MGETYYIFSNTQDFAVYRCCKPSSLVYTPLVHCMSKYMYMYTKHTCSPKMCKVSKCTVENTCKYMIINYQKIQVSYKKLRCSANEHKICTVSWDNEINVQYIHAQYVHVPIGVNEYMIVLSHNYHYVHTVYMYIHTSTIYVHCTIVRCTYSVPLYLHVQTLIAV